MAALDVFTQGYIECLLWSTHDESQGEYLDANYGVEDFSDDALKTISQDCEDFQESNSGLLAIAFEKSPTYDYARAGHDFCLTRNRHGAGFWDRGLGSVGDKMTANAHPYGSMDAYVGDDGKIHVEGAR